MSFEQKLTHSHVQNSLEMWNAATVLLFTYSKTSAWNKQIVLSLSLSLSLSPFFFFFLVMKSENLWIAINW